MTTESTFRLLDKMLREHRIRVIERWVGGHYDGREVELGYLTCPGAVRFAPLPPVAPGLGSPSLAYEYDRLLLRKPKTVVLEYRFKET